MNRSFSATYSCNSITYYYKGELFYDVDTYDNGTEENISEAFRKLDDFHKGKFLDWEISYLRNVKKKLGEPLVGSSLKLETGLPKKYGFITFIAVLTIFLELIEERNRCD